LQLDRPGSTVRASRFMVDVAQSLRVARLRRWSTMVGEAEAIAVLLRELTRQRSLCFEPGWSAAGSDHRPLACEE
jgi:hypothetical protein